jgi:hypothetical protein
MALGCSRIPEFLRVSEKVDGSSKCLIEALERTAAVGDPLADDDLLPGDFELLLFVRPGAKAGAG